MQELLKKKDGKVIAMGGVIIILFVSIMVVLILWLGGFFSHEEIVESKSLIEDIIMQNFNQRMSIGDGHYAVVTSMGDLYTWGRNDFGQLGDGTTDNRDEPVKVLEKVMSVQAAGNMTFALKSDGSLWGWGEDTNRLIAFDNNATESTQKIINTPLKMMDYVRYISVSSDYIMVVRTDDTLWGWGSDLYGKISLLYTPVENSMMVEGETIYSSFALTPRNEEYYLKTGFIPFPEQMMEDVLFVSTGTNHTAAVTYDNKLLVWGECSEGKLGRIITDATYRSAKDLMESVYFVSAAANNTAVLDIDGNLHICGSNTSGLFGKGTIGSDSEGETLSIGLTDKILEKSTFVQLGADKAAALTRNGNLYFWGRDTDRYFSKPENQEIITAPLLYAEKIKAVCISQSKNKFIMKKNDNSLWYWGDEIGKTPIEIILPLEDE